MTQRTTEFGRRLKKLTAHHDQICRRRNAIDDDWLNGICARYRQPVLTRDHVPLAWRFDLNPATNPFLLERLGVNAVFNPGAIYRDGKFLLVARVEGADRKSFFAVAESRTGVDQFRFWDFPVDLPERDADETNIYDLRLVQHADGWLYGIFCTERRDPRARPGDLSAAIAQCGIVRTHDLRRWERLPDIRTPSRQQRNIVLHPEFVNGQYGFYTRPADDFMEAGTGGGIGWGLVRDLQRPVIRQQTIIDPRGYHTIKEGKNGLGPAPIKTARGWLQLAHGVRTNAAGMRYVLYAFLTALDDPARVIAAPGGYLLAPRGMERVGDVSDVLFCNGWAVTPDGRIFLYYASSDTRIHVATTTVAQLLDYVLQTPPDARRTRRCFEQRRELIQRNRAYQTKGRNR